MAGEAAAAVLNHGCLAVAKRLLKCVIGFVQMPRLPSLNKCAAADLGYLPVVNRIHLPALQWALRHMQLQLPSPPTY